MKTKTWAVLVLFLACAGPTLAAEDGVSAWVTGPNSRARLVSAGAMAQGAYRTGVEIRLDGEALTYWRMPGEAGVPPTFDFSKSTNLVSADVAYPAPFRLEEAGQEAFGYRREVIFPIKVVPRNPALPVQFDLHLNYAACEKICIPAEANLRISLAPGAPATVQAQRIADYQARVPKQLEGTTPPLALITPLEGHKPKWSVRFDPPLAAESDLFAEGPDDWFFDTKRKGSNFELILAQKPKAATLPVRVVLTYRDGARAFERVLHLDAAAANP